MSEENSRGPGAESEAARRRGEGDELLIKLLAAGWYDYATAGAMVGVSDRTVRRRVSDAGFAGRLALERAARREELASRLGDLERRAIDTVVEVLDSARPGDRLRAAGMILDQGLRLRAQVELDRRFSVYDDLLGLVGDSVGEELSGGGAGAQEVDSAEL